MPIEAGEAVPGPRYRPTRSTDVVGRSTLRRPTPGQEKAAVRRLELRYSVLSGQEMFVLSRLKQGYVLFRMDTLWNGETSSRWVAVPSDYSLRRVKK
jgi:hypothetical protein|tara:strand:- start:225 stop:515 length:291 start_codon:yes stop_codon:yes gene_type:complete